VNLATSLGDERNEDGTVCTQEDVVRRTLGSIGLSVLISLVTSLAAWAQPLVGGPQFRVDAARPPAIPNLAAPPDAAVVVTWEEIDSRAAIIGQSYDRMGRPTGDAFRVESPSELYGRSVHAVAADADGDFVVVWTTNGNTVFGQRFDSSGNERADMFEVARDGYYSPAVGMGPAGDFVVAMASSSRNVI
jgi:hypothetical protein